jgi:dUTPase
LDTGAGVIDADYRGPVGVVMFNFSKVDYEGTNKYLKLSDIKKKNT